MMKVERSLEGTWALVLGGSSGFGEAVSLELAGLGMHILGVHLDRKSTLANVDRIVGAIKDKGREALFFNGNAADPDKRREILDAFQARAEGRGAGSHKGPPALPGLRHLETLHHGERTGVLDEGPDGHDVGCDGE